MNTILLLLKTQRRELGIGVPVCFVVTLAMSFLLMEPSNTKAAYGVLAASLILAVIVASMGGMYAALYRLPAPVTHRQLAWVPTLCLAILCAAGITGMCTGMIALSTLGHRQYSLSQWMPLCFDILKIMPIGFLFFALMDRIIRLFGPQALFVFFFSSLMYNSLLAVYNYGWPLCIVLGIAFILEAPALIASLEHPKLVDNGVTKNYMRLPGSPVKSSKIKVLMDILMFIPFLMLIPVMLPILSLFPTWDELPLMVKVYYFAIGVGILIGILIGIRHCWRNTRANNFGQVKALLIFLMQCSVMLLPVARAMGAKRGVIASCDRCQKLKFIWARKCPYCADTNQGTVVPFWPTLPWKKDKDKISTPIARHHMPSRRLYRMFSPLLLLILSVFTSDAVFHDESFRISLHKNDQLAPEGTQARIKEFLVSEIDTTTWLRQHGGEEPILPPQFRIEVKVLGSQALEVHCYWLRWEDAGEVAEHLRDHLLTQFSDTPLQTNDWISKSDYERARINVFALRGYLDGQIHWKNQKTKSTEQLGLTPTPVAHTPKKVPKPNIAPPPPPVPNPTPL